jgi:uncharacterized membrane protein YqiK
VLDAIQGSLVGILIILGLIILAIVLVVVIIKTAWKVAEPNEALIVTGRKARGQPEGAEESMKFNIVTGSGVFVIPALQTCRALSLNLVKTDLNVKCVTKQGIPVDIQGSVIFKVGDTYNEIANAARRFLSNQGDMVAQVHSIFSGHLRAIVGNMTMEELISDREVLRANVREASGTEMANLGLKIDSMQILEIGDPSGYIANLSAPNIAAARALARSAEADRNREATEREQLAAVAISEAQTAAQKRQSELKAEADRASQTAAMAGPLAHATAQQEVVIAQTRAAELAADLKAKQLETDVRKPADARAYETEVNANAARAAAIAQAEAEARRTELQALADANAVKIRGEAEAASTQARGLAEAETVQAKGLAEAAALEARARALETGQDAVIAQQVAENLPAIAREFAAPFGQIDQLTVLNGAEGMSQMVNGSMAQLVQALPQLLSLSDAVRSRDAESGR